MLQNKKELINAIAGYFVKQPVSKAFVFGSITDNKFNDKSDIDILVELNEKNIGMQFIQMYLDLKNLTGHEIDLVTSDAISKYIADKVDQQKVLIYERAT